MTDDPILGRQGYRRVLGSFRADHMVRNSFYLLLSTATVAALGFAFWVLCARLYPPAEIGLMTTLVSAAGIISYLSLLGVNNSLTRVLPRSSQPGKQVSAAAALVFGAGVVISLLYVAGLPIYVSELSFVTHSWTFAATFVVVTALAGVNLLTDAVFIAKRSAHLNFIVDGVVQGLAKLLLPVLLVGLGAFSVFFSFGAGAVVASVLSLVLIHRVLGIHLTGRTSLRVLAPVLHFSAASYVASIFNLLPLLALPLIVVHQLGAEQAGYYNIAFQIANLLNAISHAVGEAIFAEASQHGADRASLRRRSVQMLLAVQLPAAAVVALGSQLLLSLFGASYAQNGAGTLVVLSVASVAVAFNVWTSFLLKIEHRLPPLVLSNVAYLLVTTGLAYLWASHGALGVAAAWLVGNALCGAIAAGALARPKRSAAYAEVDARDHGADPDGPTRG